MYAVLRKTMSDQVTINSPQLLLQETSIDMRFVPATLPCHMFFVNLAK